MEAFLFVKSIFENLLKFCDWGRPSLPLPLLKINAAILAFSMSGIVIGGEKKY
jgi:hypothetical protein